jgi:hypothetical protein
MEHINLITCYFTLFLKDLDTELLPLMLEEHLTDPIYYINLSYHQTIFIQYLTNYQSNNRKQLPHNYSINNRLNIKQISSNNQEINIYERSFILIE